MLLRFFTLCCLFHPISLVLPKETGWSPKERRFWGGGAPVRFRDPPASPTRVGGATRPLRCPRRGRIGSLAPRARGLGWWKSSQVKVFCPAFLQKSGRGPGAEPLDARRSARNSLVLTKRRRGLKGEPSPGVPPFFFTLVRVRRYVGRWSLAPAAFRPHFFGACPKKRCRAAKEKRFLPRWLHHPRERSCLGGRDSSSPDLGRGLVQDTERGGVALTRSHKNFQLNISVTSYGFFV